MAPSAPARPAPPTRPVPAGHRGALAAALALAGAAAMLAVGLWPPEPPVAPGVVLAPLPASPAPGMATAQGRNSHGASPTPAPHPGAGLPAPPMPAPPIAAHELSALHPVLAEHFLKDVRLQRSPHGGAEVLSVARGSLYARMGLRAGDRVYTLDSEANAGVDDHSMVSLMQMSTLELAVVRAGHPITLRLALNDDTEYAAPAKEKAHGPD
jgi:hypothetical protein